MADLQFPSGDYRAPVVVVPDLVSKHPAWLRLDDQLQWYAKKSRHCRKWYKFLKVVQVALAVSIPVMSLLPSDLAKWIMAVSGILITLLETFQQMNQYATLWVAYRSTAERLKHEKYLFLSAAGPYRDMSDADRLVVLAERVEEHVSTEHANWVSEVKRGTTSDKMDSGQKGE